MSLINAEGEEPTFFSPPHAVMVPPVGRIDKIFDSKMTKLIAEREKRADAQENTNPYSQDDENNASLVHNFLSDGLDLKQVHRALFRVVSIFLYAFFLLFDKYSNTVVFYSPMFCSLYSNLNKCLFHLLPPPSLPYIAITITITINAQTKDLARSANLLVNKHSGRQGSYGLVLEDLLHAKGQTFNPVNPAIQKMRDSQAARDEAAALLGGGHGEHGNGHGGHGHGHGHGHGQGHGNHSGVHSHSLTTSSSTTGGGGGGGAGAGLSSPGHSVSSTGGGGGGKTPTAKTPTAAAAAAAAAAASAHGPPHSHSRSSSPV
jgi:hypothetical protein